MSQTKKKGIEPAAKLPMKPVSGGWGEAMEGLFAGMFGAFLGLSLLKFGNPFVIERMITWPTNIYEWVLIGWPIAIGHGLLFAVTVAGLPLLRWKRGLPMTLVALPLLWLVWELAAAMQTESARLSKPAVIHFLCCVDCFYLGLFALSGSRRTGSFWAGLVPGFLLVLCSGFEQHFGGLAESRKWFMYMYEKAGTIDPTFLKKLTKDRIFATLFYPNTLAGAILLLLPVTLAALWSMRERFTAGARMFLVAVAGLASMACLFWSGSKGGWLLMLVIVVVGAMFLPMNKRFKVILAASVLVVGLAGFTAKYLGFFKTGATSVVARFDYWEAALKTVNAKPVFGTGPGTFGIAYERVRRSGSEMAQLTHNDYLEQASDSGLVGFVLYGAMVAGTLVYTWRKGFGRDWVRLAVWLGVLGWALHCFIEFELYIPALSWVAFAFMGWLLGESGNQIDTGKATSYSGARQ